MPALIGSTAPRTGGLLGALPEAGFFPQVVDDTMVVPSPDGDLVYRQVGDQWVLEGPAEAPVQLASATGDVLQGLLKFPGGLPSQLDRSATAATRRSLEQGYDPRTFYHGTEKLGPEGLGLTEMPQTDIGVHLGGNPTQANKRLQSIAGGTIENPSWSPMEMKGYDPGANILPLRARLGKSLEMRDIGMWKDSETVAGALGEMGFDTDDIFQDAMELKGQFEDPIDWLKSDENRRNLDDLSALLQSKGYNSIKYRNEVENAFGANAGMKPAVKAVHDELTSRMARIDAPARARSRAAVDAIPDLPQDADAAAVQRWLDAKAEARTANYLTPDERAEIERLTAETERLYDDPANFEDPHSYIILDPSRVRSTAAQFDPERMDEGDLLASVGPGAVLAGSAVTEAARSAEPPPPRPDLDNLAPGFGLGSGPEGSLGGDPFGITGGLLPPDRVPPMARPLSPHQARQDVVPPASGVGVRRGEFVTASPPSLMRDFENWAVRTGVAPSAQAVKEVVEPFAMVPGVQQVVGGVELIDAALAGDVGGAAIAAAGAIPITKAMTKAGTKVVAPVVRRILGKGEPAIESVADVAARFAARNRPGGGLPALEEHMRRVLLDRMSIGKPTVSGTDRVIVQKAPLQSAPGASLDERGMPEIPFTETREQLGGFEEMLTGPAAGARGGGAYMDQYDEIVEWRNELYQSGGSEEAIAVLDDWIEGMETGKIGNLLEGMGPARAAAPKPAGLPREDNGFVGAGGEVLVFRLGSQQGGLAGRNAGNVNSLATHLRRIDDYEAPAFAGGSGDTITAYRVILRDEPGKYQGTVSGRARSGTGEAARDELGRVVEGPEDFRMVSYSFPASGKGYEYEAVGQVPLTAVRAKLKEMGYTSADDAGDINTAAAIRSVWQDEVAKTSAPAAPTPAAAAAPAAKPDPGVWTPAPAPKIILGGPEKRGLLGGSTAPVREQSAVQRIRKDMSGVFSPDTEQPVTTIDELYDVAKKAEPNFIAEVDSLAARTGAAARYTPAQYAEEGTRLKSRASAERKLRDELGGDPALLLDVVRATVEHNKTHGARAAAAKFIEELGPRLVRVKDRFVNDTAGYRDILVNYRTDEGVIAEVQFGSKEMLRVKQEEGHRLYEELRSLDARDLPDEVKNARKAELVRKSRAIYDAAYVRDGDGRWGR